MIGLPVAGAFLLAGAGTGCADMPDRDQGSDALRRARPGDVAIAQELDSARRAGTISAYDLFIARHPDHPLAAAARLERAKLRRSTGR